MSNDFKVIKFETFIEDIYSSIPVNTSGYCRYRNAAEDKDSPFFNSALALIYEYDKLNDFGKTIVNNTHLYVLESEVAWEQKYQDLNELKDFKVKLDAVRELVRQCNNNDINFNERYKFIFWAMMILTVDKTDADEHLSLICDFARMLKITDDEMDDMLQVIKLIYHENDGKVQLKSENLRMIFSDVIKMYQAEKEVSSVEAAIAKGLPGAKDSIPVRGTSSTSGAVGGLISYLNGDL